MKSSEMLTEIKTLLGLVKLEQMKLENGTVIEAESFDAGNDVFIVSEEDKVAIPVGEYTLENGQVLVIQEEGVIGEIKEAEEAPADAPADAPAEEEMQYVSKEEFTAAIDEIKMMIKEMMSSKEEDLKEEVKEELSIPQEVVEAVKEDLSAPAAEAIKHNPEANNNKVEMFQYSPNRTRSTKDRVLEKIFNL
jgi:hypothetical protein